MRGSYGKKYSLHLCCTEISLRRDTSLSIKELSLIAVDVSRFDSVMTFGLILGITDLNDSQRLMNVMCLHQTTLPKNHASLEKNLEKTFVDWRAKKEEDKKKLGVRVRSHLFEASRFSKILLFSHKIRQRRTFMLV